MAVFWVQHYFTLPVIYEDLGMGHELQPGRQPYNTVDDNIENQGSSSTPVSTSVQTGAPQQSMMEVENYPGQHFGPGAAAFNMMNMANVLPDYRTRTYGGQYRQQYAPMGHVNPQFMYQNLPGGQFAGQSASQYQNPYAQQYSTQFMQQHQQQQYQQSPSQHPHIQGHFPANVQAFTQQQMYPSQQVLQNVQNLPPNMFQSLPGQPGAGFGMRGTGAYNLPTLRVDSNIGSLSALPLPQFPLQNLSRHSSDSSLRPTVPRGPPRKPKQSGHALWVGNLPPGTNVLDLKDHFSREATEDIESVFLISKSNCAFVNYKTEVACSAAMSRFHDSRFQGVRLVCRLRRGSTPTSATAPSPSAQEATMTSSSTATHQDSCLEPTTTTADDEASQEITSSAIENIEKASEKYFIVKSLTVEDLEMSAENGIWATQAHNEAALNKAYQTAESVYLIFSANKSGEYFGYAKMTSAIGDEAAADVEIPLRTTSTELPQAEHPMTIPTPATSTAPKGHIIDDSARGTIFWEAEIKREPGDHTDDGGNTSGEGETYGEAQSSSAQTFGKPFRITWMSTERLPFYRTRGLRNPWNSNREVKIARDGTELEPSVGRRLVTMFHRPQLSQSPAATRSQMPAPNYGYQQQQPPYPGSY